MSKLDTVNQVIEGVGFYYAKIQQASPKFNPEEGNEYSVDAHVDKATAKAWNKEFSKNKAKEMEYEKFVEKFGVENAIGDDDQFFIKLKKAETYKHKTTGEDTPIPEAFRPRVLLDDGEGNLEDVTFTKLVGNGSKGVMQYEINENKYGKFANLVAIKIDELVVYEAKTSDTSDKFNVLGKVKAIASKPVPKKPVGDSENVGSGASEATPEPETSGDEDW